jgi:hypothetical protein
MFQGAESGLACSKLFIVAVKSRPATAEFCPLLRLDCVEHFRKPRGVALMPAPLPTYNVDAVLEFCSIAELMS